MDDTNNIDKEKEDIGKRNNQTDNGTSITHEQVSDVYAEGTVEAKIASLEEHGKLKSHDGKKISKKGFKK